MSVDAIVALKARAQSKMRLTSVLGDTAREALVEAMAADVLSCLLMHPEIEAVHVISGAGWSGVIHCRAASRCGVRQIGLSAG